MTMQSSEHHSPDGPVSPQPARLGGTAKRGKRFRHELLVKMALRGTRTAGPDWIKTVGCVLHRTLQRVLGPDAPLGPLLEDALFEAVSSWPPSRAEEPVSVWGQRIATGVALAHLKQGKPSAGEGAVGSPPAGAREVLSHLYGRLRELRPEEQVAFALLELDGRSVSEAALVLRVSPMVVRQRAWRVRRHLLFAARRDRLLTRYLCSAVRSRALADRCGPAQLGRAR